jgi:hypothetical protein
MPNWCDNTVYITHDDPKKIQVLVDAWKENKFFGTIHPEPDYTKVKVKPTFNSRASTPSPEFVSPESAWWDWRVQNWGTKWEITTDEAYIDTSENEIRVSFATAWSPPTGIFDKLVDQGYGVNALYYEGGCAFCGQYVDGSDETYGTDGKWMDVKNTIPDNIDLEFGITENMKEWAMQELAEEIEGLEESLSEDKDNHETIAQLIAKKKELEEMENA